MQPKATGCPPKEEQPESKRQKAAPAKIVCSGTERTDYPQTSPKEGRSAESPEPKGPPKLFGPPVDPKEEEGSDQRPEAAKKAKPMAPPGELRIPASKGWLSMSAHERMGLPEEEDIAVIHVSAPPHVDHVPKTFVCTKKQFVNQTVYTVTVRN